MHLDWVGPLLLCDEEVERVPEGIPCVYLLQAFARSIGAYPVFYVGSTSDLRRRLREHLSRRAKPAVQAVRVLERVYFSAAPVWLPNLVRGVEAGLIRILRPMGNSVTPAAEPVLVNLPPLKLIH